MKLSLLFLIAFSTLSFASNAQMVSLRLKNASLESVLSSIETQTQFTFVYKKGLLNRTNRVNIDISNQSLEESLKLLFSNQPIAYEIYESQIVLSSKPNASSLGNSQSLLSSSIQQTLSGLVTDSLGNPIQGVTVSNLSRKSNASTNSNGQYSLLGSVGDKLQFSSIGYVSVILTTSSGSNNNVILKLSDNTIDDVVVTALGIKRSEKTLSYQIQKVSGEDLSVAKGSNFVNSLVGKVAGAQINTSASGPGGGVKVVLRGSKSIALNNNALYVIDGIPMNNFVNEGGDGSYGAQQGTEAIADINPDDIEDISVMTGPSAAALYGYEGANGVILITTKKGKADQTRLSVMHNTMFSSPLLLPKFQNKYGNSPGSTQSWGGEVNSGYEPSNFFQTGYNVNNAVSLSTGSDRSQSYFSVASNNAEGIIDNNKYSRYNFAYRNTTNFLNDKLLLDVSANYIIQNNLNMFSQGEYFNPLPAVYLFPRGEDFSAIQLYERYDEVSDRMTQYWPYGDQGLTLQNPYWTMNRMDRNADRNRYMLTTSLKYVISDKFNVVGRVNVDNMNQRYTDNRFAGTLGILSGKLGRHSQQNMEQKQLYADLIANYKNNWNDVSLNLNFGGSIKDRKSESSALTGDLDKIGNYFSLENLDRSVGTFKMDSNGFRKQTQSVFASAELGFRNYLFLNLTGRNDWDSALAMSLSDERSFFYPSIGLSAVINEMVEMPSWFSFLKLRGSYAEIGRPYDSYLTTLQYVYDDQTNTYSLPKIRPNHYLKPEITGSFEFGTDMRFFNNALTFNFTYYSSDTRNQTHTILESGTEYNAKLIQAGKVRNSGVEMLLGIDKKWGNLGWASNITYSYNKNKIVQLYSDELMAANPELDNYVDKAVLGRIGSPVVRLTDGGTLGDIYSTSNFKRDNNGYIYLNPTTLLPMIENYSSKEYRKMGTTLPTSHVGWRNSFSYDAVKLNIALSGRFGGLVVSNTQAILDRYGVSENSLKLREQGGINILGNDISAQDYFNTIGEGTGKSDYYTYKADNVRLQEVSLEYKLKDSWLWNKANATIGIVGNNLLMIYNKAPFDPEATPNSTSTYYSGVDLFLQPSQRSFGFNLKLQF